MNGSTRLGCILCLCPMFICIISIMKWITNALSQRWRRKVSYPDKGGGSSPLWRSCDCRMLARLFGAHSLHDRTQESPTRMKKRRKKRWKRWERCFWDGTSDLEDVLAYFKFCVPLLLKPPRRQKSSSDPVSWRRNEPL